MPLSSLLIRAPTPLVSASWLADAAGLERAWFKMEGDTPTGGHKFWLVRAVVEAALRGGASGLTAASCGNYGQALLWHGQRAGLPVQVFFVGARGAAPHALADHRSGSYEEALERSRVAAARRGWMDANPGPALSGAFGEALACVASETHERLGRVPQAMFCPVGNGTTLAGIHAGFAQWGAAPQMHGATSNNVLTGAATRTGIDAVVEPLRSELPLDGEPCMQAIRSSGGALHDVPRHTILAAHTLMAEHGFDIHPASAAPVAAILGRRWHTLREALVVVTSNLGGGLAARRARA